LPSEFFLSKRAPPSDPTADPFREHSRTGRHATAQLLGARIRFDSDSAQLLALVRHAYAGLPPHRFGARVPQLRVALVRLPAPVPRASRTELPLLMPAAGAGLLVAATAGGDLMGVDAARRGALVAVSAAHLKFSYHVRYELLEFAVYLLAARAQGLVPLHAACVGREGSGVLLLGPSGAGKSTFMVESLAQGLEFLAEDSVLVQPRSLRATGIANFLHLRTDSLRFVSSLALARHIRSSPVIRRRSGARKFEVDLRRPGLRLAPAPLRLRALVFLSPVQGRGALLRPLTPQVARARLSAEQPYAAGQAGWQQFLKRAARLPAFELRRAAHPRAAVETVAQLLQR
jgi:hypothetical protein